MKNILKYTKANVRITDKEAGNIIFEDHNLFVDAGRAFIANFFFDPYPFDKSKMVCDLGDNAAAPAVTDLDLGNYLTGCSVGLTGGVPQVLSGSSTGVLFQFSFPAPADKTIKELGLFYRPFSDTFPLRGSDPTTMKGTMIARLKTAGSSITIAAGKTINIEWKIIF